MPDDVQSYTFGQFSDAVKGLLPRDSQRIGKVPAYIAAMTRLGVIELQSYIPGYRKDHESLYLPSDFVGEGWASRAALPPQALPKQAFLVYYELDATGAPKQPLNCTRHPLENFPWENRMALVNSKVAVNGGKGCVCFDRGAGTFYVYPGLRDCQNVSLFWDGLKINFQDNETTPFDEQMTLVVADYVKSKICREIDQDLAMAASYDTSYIKGRQSLYLTVKNRGSVNPS